MPNPGGHPATLVAAHPGNQSRLVHGAYPTGRALEARAAEISAQLTELPHVHPIDAVAAEEIGTIIARLEGIDRELGRERTTGRRWLFENKARLGRELRAWLREFGATPKARAEWAAALARTSLADDIRARLAERVSE